MFDLHVGGVSQIISAPPLPLLLPVSFWSRNRTRSVRDALGSNFSKDLKTATALP